VPLVTVVPPFVEQEMQAECEYAVVCVLSIVTPHGLDPAIVMTEDPENDDEQSVSLTKLQEVMEHPVAAADF
jgi:hypothetical protein